MHPNQLNCPLCFALNIISVLTVLQRENHNGNVGEKGKGTPATFIFHSKKTPFLFNNRPRLSFGPVTCFGPVPCVDIQYISPPQTARGPCHSFQLLLACALLYNYAEFLCQEGLQQDAKRGSQKNKNHLQPVVAHQRCKIS